MHASLLEILHERAHHQPHQQAYLFLPDGETESESLTYAELDLQARAIATQLEPWRHERALLLYPSGLDFIKAFFGCLYAGVIAVPVYPPKRNQKLSRLLAIAEDAQAKIALTTDPILKEIEQRWENAPSLAALKLLTTDGLPALIPNPPAEVLPTFPQGTDIAFLQYTSGSTGTPKGVMITHRNIIHNQQLIQSAFGHTRQSIGVGWLPLFHDMGLIGHVFQPLYVGFPSVLMPPVAFLTSPIRWLKAISKYRATTSGGPNFAYDFCIHRISDPQLSDLDLSSWNLAYSGAEPVRAETLEKFSEKFAPYQFQPEAFYPCYGMAESTLFITGGDKGAAPIISHLPASADPEHPNPANPVVGCGYPHRDTAIAIVDPETFQPCTGEAVGEIWVRGDSVAAGYWNRPQQTQETFQAAIADQGGSETYLRTGDLGFLQDGELFVTGRLKDLIIIRGKNHYPQDLELTTTQAHPALRENCGAAFSVELDGQERLVIVQEVKRTYLRDLDVDEVVGAIRQAIATTHELQVYAVILIKTGSIPKTSSGKIQRHACKQGFLDNSLLSVGVSILGHAEIQPTVKIPQHHQPSLIVDLCEQIAKLLNLPQDAIQPEQKISTLGLDSILVVDIKNYIEERFDVSLPMEKFFEDITVAELAHSILTFSESNHDSEKKPEIHTATDPISLPETPEIDLDSRLKLVYKKGRDVLQRAREFELPDQLRQSGLMPYFRELERNEGATCIFEGRQLIMLGSNNYLGLTADHRVREATAKAALEEGPSLTGSRLLNGTTHKHRELEEKIAAFVGHEDALVFTTGYQANLGFISALMNEETTIVLDSEAHACIFDGAFMSRCKVVQYHHNDLQDLDRKLASIAPDSATMVVVDGLYSMTGDIVPLPELRAVCDRHRVTLAVDDAHALGVLGKAGRGTEEHFNMIGKSDILCGTFSKSLASIGGWVAAEAKVIDWIRFNGRSMLFSASIPPTALAAASTALDILMAEPWRVDNIRKNADYWKSGLESLGFKVRGGGTPIITVVIGDDMDCLVFCKELLGAGVYVNSAVYPAVPRKSALLRTSVMATHTTEHLDRALEVFASIGRKLKVIA